MKKYLAYVAAALAAIIMTGCVQLPKQAYNRAAHADVKRIAVLDPAQGDEYILNIANHPAMGFGLIGGLVLAAELSAKQNTLNGALKGFNYRMSDDLGNQLTSALREAGYDARRVPLKRDKQALLESYKGLDENFDAYLDSVVVWHGYMANGPTADYIPVVRVSVRLVDRKTSAVLYSEFFNYGLQWAAQNWVNFPADAKYAFGTLDVLTSQAPLAMDGIKSGVPVVVRQVRNDLAVAKP